MPHIDAFHPRRKDSLKRGACDGYLASAVRTVSLDVMEHGRSAVLLRVSTAACTVGRHPQAGCHDLKM